MYQKGEVISYIITILKVFYPLFEKDPEIIELELNFLKGNFISENNIQQLALSRAKLNQ